MNRFGAGKEHRLGCFWGLMVPVRSTEKGILAKFLFLANGPAPGQCSKDKRSPRTESQPGMGQASPATATFPRGILPAVPTPGLCPQPVALAVPHAVSVACGAMLQDSQTASALIYLSKEFPNQTPRPPWDAGQCVKARGSLGGACRHRGSTEAVPPCPSVLRGLCWRRIFLPSQVNRELFPPGQSQGVASPEP